jgi:hypothetical protein
MNNALAPRDNADLSIMEQVIIKGDLAKLTPDERVQYYGALCHSVGLNPMTKPFEYIELNGKLTLYARKDAGDQLRQSRKVKITKIEKEVVDDVYVVTAHAETADGRTDYDIGAVALVKENGEWKTAQGSGKKYFQGNGTYTKLAPEDRANAMMKAITKAKRRVTLSICGLGFLDETEIKDIPQAKATVVDMETGEIIGDSHGASFDPNVPQPSGRPTGAKITNKAAAVKALMTARERCEQLVETGVIDLAGCDEDTSDKYDRAFTLNIKEATPEAIQGAVNWLTKFANINEQQAQNAAAVEV